MTEPIKVPYASGKSTEGMSHQRVTLRDFSKGIFLYPLAIYSFVAALIEHFMEDAESGGADPSSIANILALIWVVLFFFNVFVVSFDMSTGKFLILILLVAIVGLAIFLLINSGIIAPATGGPIEFNLDIRTHFYVMMTAILGIVILFVLIVSRFRYVRVETNEILVKGILGDVKRFPTANLHYDKKISDVFEFLTLRAGTIILHITGAQEPVELYTVPNVNKKARMMDALLSTLRVSH